MCKPPTTLSNVKVMKAHDTWRHVSALMSLIWYLDVSDMSLLVRRNRESVTHEATCGK
ncbi:hypothetical protein J6590_031410 [Homalodisca vitripennis]|nr:hypothetical protein J6590_031410 [Homalodisca vitripennis]